MRKKEIELTEEGLRRVGNTRVFRYDINETNNWIYILLDFDSIHFRSQERAEARSLIENVSNSIVRELGISDHRFEVTVDNVSGDYLVYTEL